MQKPVAGKIWIWVESLRCPLVWLVPHGEAFNVRQWAVKEWAVKVPGWSLLRRSDAKAGACSHPPYPWGLALCQAQPSRHISSRERRVRQSSRSAAREASATVLAASPWRRSPTM